LQGDLVPLNGVGASVGATCIASSLNMGFAYLAVTHDGVEICMGLHVVEFSISLKGK
jgi:hypothetical protein